MSCPFLLKWVNLWFGESGWGRQWMLRTQAAKTKLQQSDNHIVKLNSMFFVFLWPNQLGLSSKPLSTSQNEDRWAHGNVIHLTQLTQRLPHPYLLEVWKARLALDSLQREITLDVEYEPDAHIHTLQVSKVKVSGLFAQSSLSNQYVTKPRIEVKYLGHAS